MSGLSMFKIEVAPHSLSFVVRLMISPCAFIMSLVHLHEIDIVL